jgi:hypothetical protein
MFNLIKFEIIKRKKLFTTLGILFLIAQVFAIYKISIGATTDSLAVIFIISAISYIVFIFSSISTFSKDITSTDHSIVFMVPQSGFTIITAKFLGTLILGVGLLSFGSLLTFINIYYMTPEDALKSLDYIRNNPYIINKFILSIATLGSFFALVFLSIIVTKTFLAKLKFKTLITIIVMAILSKIFNLIFWNNLDEISSLNASISILGTIFITTVMLWISGWLVDNKTDF